MNNLNPPLALAPMATLTHRGLRTLIETWGGCDYYFSEMIHCRSYHSGRRFESYYSDPGPVAEKTILQFVGSHVEDFEKALIKAQNLPVKGFDVNMGCSAHQIYGYGGGIAWMEQPAEARKLVETLRPLVGDKTLSVKLRLGIKEEPEKLEAFCKGLQDAGVDFITLHPRTRKDTLSRPSRWSHLVELKNKLTIPVWGNGDIKDFGTFEKAKNTGADGLMIGREAVRSPWIFHYLKEKQKNPGFRLEVDLQEEVGKFHNYLEAWQPEDFWATRAQRFWAYFSQHFLFGHKLAIEISKMDSYDQIKARGLKYLELHPQEWKKIVE